MTPTPARDDPPPDLLWKARQHVPRSDSPAATMEAYRAYRDTIRKSVLSTYDILGFLSSGTYGRVYKAALKNSTEGHAATSAHDSEASGRVFAIKKFKPDKEDHAVYTGISQSAMREIALNRELRHENIITLREVVLEDKAIYMVFSYASHDLLQLIHHHSTVLREGLALPVLKSLLFQLLNGVHYLHSQYVLHRDLKPANILLTCDGVVKIADLGLARINQAPLQSLYSGDKVVVTIWYRAPELLLGARHYNAKIDMWAIGCIWGELLALRPMFKGEEAKMDPKTKSTPFQSDQITRIMEILGNPTKERWPAIEHLPDYKHLWPMVRLENYPNTLFSWYEHRALSPLGFDLFDALLQYDPNQRLNAHQALLHPWFQEVEPFPTQNAFASLPKGQTIYPSRRLIKDESDPKMVATHVPPVINGQAGNGAFFGSGTATGTGNGVLGGSNSAHNPNVPHLRAAHPSSSNLLSAVGPSAPPPAPGSGGSVGPPSSMNSVGPSSGGGIGILAGTASGAGGSSSNLVATATANANRQAKRARNR